MPIVIGTILIVSSFANSGRTAGHIGMGEALFDVFRSRGDDGAHRELIGVTWHMPIGTLLIFSLITNKVLTRARPGGGYQPPPSGFSQIAKKRRRVAPPNLP